MSLEKIGNTDLHLINSEKINPYTDNVSILIKLEDQNPTKSIKDRMVYHVVSEAKKELSDQTTFVSASSGNTGTALAYVCKLLNFKCIIVTNTKCSEEKINACKSHGAKVIIADSEAPPDSDENYQNIAINLAAANPTYFDLDQYEQFRKQDYSESKLPVDTHKKLADYFKPHNQRLYEFLGRKFDWE